MNWESKKIHTLLTLLSKEEESGETSHTAHYLERRKMDEYEILKKT